MKKEWLVKTLVMGIILLFVCMSINPSFAINNVKKSSMPIFDGNILYVGGSGEGNYTKIQDAIDNATDGDTVFVYDDSSPYYGYVFVDKSIKLQGENMNTTIIQGVSYISSDHVIITGFTFWRTGSALSIFGFSNNIIENCVFNGEAANLLVESGSDNNIIRNCSFTYLKKDALRIFASDNNEISYCDFFDNENGYSVSPIIQIVDSFGIKINNCNITRNNEGGILVIASSVKMRSNNIFNNDNPGVLLRLLSSCDLRYNWWGGPNGPNVTMLCPFLEKHWGLGPVTIREVDNGDNVIFSSPILLVFNRIRPWLSEPVADVGQQT